MGDDFIKSSCLRASAFVHLPYSWIIDQCPAASAHELWTAWYEGIRR